MNKINSTLKIVDYYLKTMLLLPELSVTLRVF